MAFENHTENRWVMANEILEENEPVRALLVQMIERIDRELASSDAVAVGAVLDR